MFYNCNTFEQLLWYQIEWFECNVKIISRENFMAAYFLLI